MSSQIKTNEKKISIYVRCSTNEGKDALLAQEKVCKNYISKEFPNSKIVNIYSDFNISALKPIHERHSLVEMLKDAGNNDFNTIVFYSLDRLGRKIDELQEIFAHVHSLNIDLYEVHDGKVDIHLYDDHEKDDKEMEDITTFIAKWEVSQTKNRIKHLKETVVQTNGH
jgi:DNA invertase Pin-like site-specific DNA recombinase